MSTRDNEIVAVLHQALEVLESAIDQLAKPYSTQAQYAITSLRAAIASYSQAIERAEHLEAEKQECFHVATIGNWGRIEWAEGIFPSVGDKMYSAPPQKEWVGLTDEQAEALIEELAEWSRYVEADTAHQTLEKHVRQVLAAHGIKEKNT